MRKEQILLVACAGLGALLIYSATGRYTEVGARSATTSPTDSVKVVTAFPPDPAKGLHAEALKGHGRSISAQVRPEKRPPLPELPPPPPAAIWWVRPIPSATTDRFGMLPTPEHWRPYRTTFTPIEPPPKEDKDKDQAAAADPNAPNAADDKPTPSAAELQKKNPLKIEKAAQLVRNTEETTPVLLEPSGPFKGQPDWVILEKWPNVTFKSSQLDAKGKTIGQVEYEGPAGLANFKTVHLHKTLANEYHEARITRGVRDNDADSLKSFAQWVFENLPKNSSDDEIPYGIAAVKLAVADMKAAYALQNDLANAKILADMQHAAFDIEGELSTYVAYLDSHKNDQGVQVLVGDAYTRAGAWATAAGYYEQAAKTGDPEARLKLAHALRSMGRSDEAVDLLKSIAGTPSVASRANLELAMIALGEARADDALGYLESAKGAGANSAINLVIGAANYCKGSFAAAESTFASVKDDKSSKPRSDRGMALVALGKLEDAQKEFDACLDGDPVNLLDPLFGRGDRYQHDASMVQKSNDDFQTAYVRSPDNPWILLRIGAIRLRDGLPDEALLRGRRLLVVAPGCDEGLWLVGRAAEAIARSDDATKVKAAQALLDAKAADETEAAALKDLVAAGTPEAKRTEWFYSLATANLRRAKEKEPDNRDFLTDYARVLIQSGRLEEAIKSLEEATDSRGGFGRGDGRLLGLLGWAKFLAKRPIIDVNEAIQRGRNARPDPTTAAWLESMKSTIERWDKTRIVEDDFHRPPSSVVGNNWTELDQALGIAAATDGERLVFKSDHVRSAAPSRDQATRVWRNDVELSRFNQTETQVKCATGVETIFHIFLGALTDRNGGGKGGRGGAAELGLGCDRNGAMVLWTTPPGSSRGNSAPQEIPVKDAAGNPRAWPIEDGLFHMIRFVRKDDAKGIFEVWLDDEKITLPPDKPDGKPITQFEIGGLASQGGGRMLSIGYLVDADAGSPVDVQVESFKVTKINK